MEASLVSYRYTPYKASLNLFERDESTGQMNQRCEVLIIALVAGNQALEVLQPRVRSLNNPASFVAPEFPPVLVRCHHVIPPLRDGRLDRTLHEQGARRCDRSCDLQSDAQACRETAGTQPALHLDAVKCPFEEFHFRRGSLRHAYSERSTPAICQYHRRRPLTVCGHAHTITPFFATTNIPSTKHSGSCVTIVC